MISGKKLIIVFVLAAVALAAALPLGLPRLQQLRANSALASANAHIARADSLMSGIDVPATAAASFSSLDGINQARGALTDADASLGKAATDVNQSREEAAAACGLSLLPGWYRDYLGKKRDAASLRLQQIDKLRQASDKLGQLYTAGPVIFQAQQDIDRLTGQLETAVGQIQATPTQAQSALTQIAQSLRGVQKQLDDRQAKAHFDLLAQISQEVGNEAGAADAAAQFAGAVATGDQGRARTAAQTLEQKLLAISAGADDLSRWQSRNIDPLLNEAVDLQAQEEELDREAASLYRP
ncbi:MAG: hypothetical protein ACYDGX_02895 [Thermoleophilia bacterium]